MSIRSSRWLPFALLCLLCAVSLDAMAAPDKNFIVRSFVDSFSPFPLPAAVMQAAKTLFWSLAVMSLVWSMAHVLMGRGDFSDLFFELIRFVIATGFFYWLLASASDPTGQGLIQRILESLGIIGGKIASADPVLREPADHFGNLGIHFFANVMSHTESMRTGDAIATWGMALGVLLCITLVAAQAALLMLMAWALGYVGIFLLGFGASRWTSQIAVNYYKHVIAVGAAILVLIVLMSIGYRFLAALEP
ncbi:MULTISPECIES: type IV secretion system protein [Dyella]|nr:MULTISPECIES: type IV secretion system protein [Dyella]